MELLSIYSIINLHIPFLKRDSATDVKRRSNDLAILAYVSFCASQILECFGSTETKTLKKST